MEKVVKYVAFDGTEFNDEEKCLIYEFEKRAENYINYFALYDYNRKPLKFSAGTSLLGDVFYIIIKDEKVIPFLDDWMIEEGNHRTIGKSASYTNIENRVGLWMWNDDERIWVHWETEMSKMRELGEYFQRFEE